MAGVVIIDAGSEDLGVLNRVKSTFFLVADGATTFQVEVHGRGVGEITSSFLSENGACLAVTGFDGNGSGSLSEGNGIGGRDALANSHADGPFKSRGDFAANAQWFGLDFDAYGPSECSRTALFPGGGAGHSFCGGDGEGNAAVGAFRIAHGALK